MVNNATITMLIISTVLCFITPVLLFVILKRRSNKLLLPIFLGITGFFIMQVLIRIPVISSLQLTYDFSMVNIFLYAIGLGLSAAIVETFARVITMKFFMKGDRRFSAGVAHGIGHGGFEAIVLVGLPYITYIMYATMINNGTFELINNGAYPDNSELVNMLKELLIDTNPVMFLLGGIERVLAMLFHISLSVLTMYGLKINSKKHMIYVLLIHTVFDASVVIMSHYGLSVYLIEVYIFLFVLVMLYIMRNIYISYLNLREDESNV